MGKRHLQPIRAEVISTADDAEPESAAPRRKKAKHAAPDDWLLPCSRPSTQGRAIAFSVTITPYKRQNGVPITEVQRFALCDTWLQHLHAAFAVRHSDQQVLLVILSRERGELKQQPHLQGVYVVWITGSKTDPTVSKDEKAWMKEVLAEASVAPNRLELKRCALKDLLYMIGYAQKDAERDHYISMSFGLEPSVLQEARDYYTAKAGETAFSSYKLNKAPDAAEKQLDIKVGNLFSIVPYFIHQHGLGSISWLLTPAIVVSFALETKRYRLDDSHVTGRTGGATLDPSRSQALFELSNMQAPVFSVALVETVLFGATQNHVVPPLDRICYGLGLPTRADVAENYNLSRAKALAQSLAGASSRAAQIMEQSGLQGTKLYSYDQKDSARGYIAAGAAVLLNQAVKQASNLDAAIQDMGLGDIQELNCDAFVALQNDKLGKVGTDAYWLTAVEILTLLARDNPEGAGTSPTWMSGPAPFNYWELYFARTVANPAKYAGEMHYMIVNSERVYNLDATVDGTPGSHWFLVAWQLRPSNDDPTAHPAASPPSQASSAPSGFNEIASSDDDGDEPMPLSSD